MNEDLKRITIRVNKPNRITRKEISDTNRKEIRNISRIHPIIIENNARLRDFKFEKQDCSKLEERIQKAFNIDTDPENPHIRPSMTVVLIVDVVEHCIRETEANG